MRNMIRILMSTFTISILLFGLLNCTGKSDNQNSSNTESKISKEQVNQTVKLPRMVDLGSKHCIPCKKMAPILDSLEIEYEGIAEIIFIDIKKNRQAAIDYGIKFIPTQVFFDAEENEVYRHTGFFSADSITAHFEAMGVQL